MRITVLGTGTSTGVPVPCCSCPVCRSTDKRNRRLRTSLHVEIQAQDLAAGAQPPGTPEHEVCAAIQIDTGPDFRFQALRAGLRRIDAVLYTHTHADHIAGIDDLRGFNFIRNEPIPVYAGAESAAELRQRFGYCFTTSPDYEGGSPPDLTLQLIEPFRPLLFAGFEVLPLPVMHGSAQVLAFRF
ncbi:MAG TPA: MBL fold metallo-hydrolase, partial [Oligoflexia bacterium]|nr:MBL fold metallo-hydrolase [Oligoflexia bacterium]